MASTTAIGLLGFGEVGQALAEDLRSVPGTSLLAYDLLFDIEDSVPATALRNQPYTGATASPAPGHPGCRIDCGVPARRHICSRPELGVA
jgi:hypothetical protein